MFLTFGPGKRDGPLLLDLSRSTLSMSHFLLGGLPKVDHCFAAISTIFNDLNLKYELNSVLKANLVKTASRGT